MSHSVGTALAGLDGTVGGMAYTTDLTDEQWSLLEPVFNTPGKRERTEREVASRLDLVLVDRGVTAAAAKTLGRCHALEVRPVGWDDKRPVFRPIRHARRVEVAHGCLGRFRRLAKSFENTTTSANGWLQVECIATTLRHLSSAHAPRALPAAAWPRGMRHECAFPALTDRSSVLSGARCQPWAMGYRRLRRSCTHAARPMMPTTPKVSWTAQSVAEVLE